MPVDVQAEVLENTRLSADYNVLRLAAPTIAAAALPGQFVMVKTGPAFEPLLRRPFSIFAVVRDERGAPSGFTLLSKRIGVGTRQLYDARPGERLACLGPLGRPFEAVAPPHEAWMVAGGVGLAPFATLAETLVARGTRATLFYGARCSADLYCADLFERLGIEMVVATEDGSRGTHGYVTTALEERLARRPPDTPVQLYACGPTAMMRRVHEVSASLGRPCLVSLEQVMGCGMGGCYSCVVRVRETDGRTHFVRSCLAGPVFDSRDIVWEALVH